MPTATSAFLDFMGLSGISGVEKRQWSEPSMAEISQLCKYYYAVTI